MHSLAECGRIELSERADKTLGEVTTVKTLNRIQSARKDFRNTGDKLTARAQAQTIAHQIITKTDDELREAFRTVFAMITN